MKTLLLLIMLFMPVIVYAESCPDIEVAKLKDMSQASIENEYCNMLKIMKKSLNNWVMTTDDKITKEIESCNNITDKMEMIYKERFKQDISKCPKE